MLKLKKKVSGSFVEEAQLRNKTASLAQLAELEKLCKEAMDIYISGIYGR